jgi:hypothetical protein
MRKKNYITAVNTEQIYILFIRKQQKPNTALRSKTSCAMM